MSYAKYNQPLDYDPYLTTALGSSIAQMNDVKRRKEQAEQQSWKNKIIDYEYQLSNLSGITGPIIQQMPTYPKKDVNGIISYFYSRKH